METTIETIQARGAFDRGFLDGHDDARRCMTRDIKALLEKNPHYAAGYSRGVTWHLSGWPATPREIGAAWDGYVDWLHECAPALAAELIEVEELIGASELPS